VQVLDSQLKADGRGAAKYHCQLGGAAPDCFISSEKCVPGGLRAIGLKPAARHCIRSPLKVLSINQRIIIKK
jgi:hypothetical protein